MYLFRYKSDSMSFCQFCNRVSDTNDPCACDTWPAVLEKQDLPFRSDMASLAELAKLLSAKKAR